MKNPSIAILRWESGHVPAGLLQLEQMPGNSTNPASYPFPVRLVEVKGANVETVITHPSQTLLADMTAHWGCPPEVAVTFMPSLSPRGVASRVIEAYRWLTDSPDPSVLARHILYLAHPDNAFLLG